MRKIAVKSDWKTLEMPEQNEIFTFDREFNDRQMQELRKGFIPAEMEDKWFCYMEGNTLFAHRSWTGFCIFIVEFSPDNHHKVIVNRNPEQYGRKSIEKDIDKVLNGLVKGRVLLQKTQERLESFN